MMRALSTTAALLITGVLALSLIAYVFAGGTGHRDAGPHCNAGQTLGQVKGELFRRAAAIRGTTDPGFDAVANYSVLRANSQFVRRHHHRSDNVTCTGTLALDLPPGVAVVGDRRNLTSAVVYELAPQANGTVRLLNLKNADTIVMPLATASNAAGQTEGISAAVPQTDQAKQAAPAQAPPSSAKFAPQPGWLQPQPAPPRPNQAAPAKSAPQPKISSERPRPKPASAPPTNVAARSPTASANPSFNCRYAHSRSEKAVCTDPGLASLDREMSSDFYRALKAANPGQRALLERTRDRFLGYRDACGSGACIADVYRGRIREISDIMAGRW